MCDMFGSVSDEQDKMIAVPRGIYRGAIVKLSHCVVVSSEPILMYAMLMYTAVVSSECV